MYKRFKDRFGTAGVVLGVIALILALGGSALAASKLNGTQKKEVEKIAKKYAGKPGAPGANGTNGTNGKDGTNGTNGAPGAAGKSVKLVNQAPTGCAKGGYTYEVEGSGVKNEVCNGEDGEDGEDGNPWSVGGTLPPGATETGTWSFNATEAAGENIIASIGFPIKLPERLEGAGAVHFFPRVGTTEEKEEFDEVCPGGSNGAGGVNPRALPGNLCVFLPPFEPLALENATFTEITVPYLTAEPGASVAGALLRFKYTGSGGAPATGFGTWAVTAPEAE